MSSEKVLGIDFGTTNSVCAVLTGDDPEVIENSLGERKTPSVAYYTKQKEQNRPLVGTEAENKAEENPDRVIRSVKRKMGNEEKIGIGGDEYVVERVAADIIRKIRTDAAEKLGIDRDRLTKAVITTPAYWEGDRKQAVVQAGEMAGFESIRTIKEPAAAAIAYGRFEPGLNKTVGVYDLGGGTFDFALVDVDVKMDNTGSEYNVMAQSGDPELGGDDWDARIVDWVVTQFMKENNDVNPLNEHRTDSSPVESKIRKERIREAARSAKEALSNESRSRVNINIPFLMNIGGEPKDIDVELSQVKFESLTEDLVEQTINPIHTALDDAGLTVNDVDDVVLVGGSTRMPQVREQVRAVFNKEPKHRVSPDEAVASGAAIKANRDDILLLEVTPLSLGIAIKGGKFKRMIERNERLPARETEVFKTASEGSTAVRIPIYQGERDIAKENRHLKTLVIEGMAPGSRNSAHIEVTFEVQQNGLINVQAVESTRSKSVEVELEGENRLPDEYISEQIEEARQKEEKDKKRQKVIDAQNNAQKSIDKAEKLIGEFRQVFDEEELSHMKKHITNVKRVRKDDTATLGDLKQATEDLDEWVLEIGDRVRKSGARSNSGPSKGPDVNPATVEDNNTSETGVRTANKGDTVTSEGTVSPDSQAEPSESDVKDWDGVAEQQDTTTQSDENSEVIDGETNFDVGGSSSVETSEVNDEPATGEDETTNVSSTGENRESNDTVDAEIEEDTPVETTSSRDVTDGKKNSNDEMNNDGVAGRVEPDSEFEMESDGTWADESVQQQESAEEEQLDSWGGGEETDADSNGDVDAGSGDEENDENKAGAGMMNESSKEGSDVSESSSDESENTVNREDDVEDESETGGDEVDASNGGDEEGVSGDSASEYIPDEGGDGGGSVDDLPLQDAEPVDEPDSEDGGESDQDEERDEGQTGLEDIGFR
jgi:molecular chaperone DnaK